MSLSSTSTPDLDGPRPGAAPRRRTDDRARIYPGNRASLPSKGAIALCRQRRPSLWKPPMGIWTVPPHWRHLDTERRRPRGPFGRSDLRRQPLCRSRDGGRAPRRLWDLVRPATASRTPVRFISGTLPLPRRRHAPRRGFVAVLLDELPGGSARTSASADCRRIGACDELRSRTLTGDPSLRFTIEEWGAPRVARATAR